MCKCYVYWWKVEKFIGENERLLGVLLQGYVSVWC
jgi:hypothetical protein